MRGTVAKRLRYVAKQIMKAEGTPGVQLIRGSNGNISHKAGTKRRIYKDLKLARKRDLLLNGARWCSRGIMKANRCQHVTELQFADLAQKYVPAARAWASRHWAKTAQVDWMPDPEAVAT